ncbi:hypothetical protein B0H10DRAFT_2217228 [Mycena sp. CBHHK59/15]|nr:hypothetical protein B0H10DRAFT_2217228 [Mycena sp. CBHHK59/15]
MCVASLVMDRSSRSRDTNSPAKPVTPSNETSAKNPTEKRTREENEAVQARGSLHRKDRPPQSTKSESRGHRRMKRDVSEVCLCREFVNTVPGRKPVDWTALAYDMYLESTRQQSPETFRPLFKEVLGRIWDVKEWRPPGQYDMFPVFDKMLLWTDWIKTANGMAYREGKL